MESVRWNRRKSHLTHFAKLLTHSHSSSSLLFSRKKVKTKNFKPTRPQKIYTLHSLVVQEKKIYKIRVSKERKVLEISFQKKKKETLDEDKYDHNNYQKRVQFLAFLYVEPYVIIATLNCIFFNFSRIVIVQFN